MIEDLLIEFDEMGFAPTTTCPNPDKYACEWKEKLVSEINCQQEQLEAAANGQETLQKALAEKDKEIKRLKNNVFCSVVIDEGKMRNIVNEKVAEFELDIESIKSEAIKEIAERLKKHYDEYDDYDDIYARHMRDDIDFLLDDMVGDTNA